MKYTHYAPRAPLHLVTGDATKLRDVSAAAQSNGERVGIICAVEDTQQLQHAAQRVIGCGSKHDLQTVACRLFAVLREFDNLEADAAVDIIFCQDFTVLGEAG